MSFEKLQWLFPIAVFVHNSEEAVWMPGWTSQHAALLPLQPPGAVGIRLALLVLTAAAFAVTYLSFRKGPKSLWAYLTFGGITALLLNVFVPHVPASLYFRGYTPGVVTAVAINLPVMSYLAFRAIRDGWVSGWRAGVMAVAVPGALGGLIALWFSL